MKQLIREMEEKVIALRGAAHGIAASMDDETITSQQAYQLLKALADSMQEIIDKRSIPE
ncbi:hypothetical protein GCM10007891_05650 [Methylophaga thalassica]|uniref:Uncharacterized protein n=1 Tax=Methylophaga thalassica TaxID=40223 RepID=A0ABQ5TR59_9GAMM|nr:hypothetical protein [Methylophaga thalassica]GLP98711.1 hypothetical protein GCM10007891_05650 [Methylophaga thalassica]